MTERTLTMPLEELRAALKAVTPHVGPADTQYANVHLTPVGEHLFVMATNGYTAAIARATITETETLTGSTADDAFDLTEAASKEVQSLFRSGKDDNEAQVQLTVTEETDEHGGTRDHEVTVTDVTGLFPGKSYTVPAVNKAPIFEKLPHLFSRALAGTGETIPGKLAMSGGLVKRFVAATLAYQEPLIMRPTGEKSMVQISCGEAFLGVLMPVIIDDDSAEGDRYLSAQRLWQTFFWDLAPVEVSITPNDFRASAVGVGEGEQ